MPLPYTAVPMTAPLLQFNQNYGYYHPLRAGTVTLPGDPGSAYDTPAINSVLMVVDLEAIPNKTLMMELKSNEPMVRFTIEWGDGKSDVYTRTDPNRPMVVSHTYPGDLNAGYYHTVYQKRFTMVSIASEKQKTPGSDTYIATTIGFPILYGGRNNRPDESPDWLLEFSASCDSSGHVKLSKARTSNVTGAWTVLGCVGLRKVIINMVADPVIDWTKSYDQMSQGFMMCTNLTSLKITNFGYVTDAGGMCLGCSNLTSVSLPPMWGTRLASTGSMFHGCTSLPSITLPASWGRIWTVSAMFTNCRQLRTVNLSGTPVVNDVVVLPPSWEKVTHISYLFACQTSNIFVDKTYGPIKIILPAASAWTNIVNADWAFANTSITEIDFKFEDGHNYTTEPFKVKSMNGMFYLCDKLTKIYHFPEEIITDSAMSVFYGVRPETIDLNITIRPYTSAAAGIYLDSMFDSFGMIYARNADTRIITRTIANTSNPITISVTFPREDNDGVRYLTPIRACMIDFVQNSTEVAAVTITGYATLTNRMPSQRKIGNKFMCLNAGALGVSSMKLTALSITEGIIFEIYRPVGAGDAPALLVRGNMTEAQYTNMIAVLRDQLQYGTNHTWIVNATDAIAATMGDHFAEKRWTLSQYNYPIWPSVDYVNYTPVAVPLVEQ